jgi:hypothetical protein
VDGSWKRPFIGEIVKPAAPSLLAFLVVLWLPSQVFCAIASSSVEGAPSLSSKLLEALDVVLLGDLVDGSAADSGSRVSCNGVVRAERVLKGGGAPGTEYRVAWEYEPPPTMGPTQTSRLPKGHGLWLLKRTGETSFRPVHLDLSGATVKSVYLRLPKAQPFGDLVYPPDASLAAKIAGELGAALEALAEAGDAALSDVQWQSERSGYIDYKLTDEQRYFQSILWVLQLLDSGDTLPVFRHLSNSRLLSLHAVGLAYLVDHGDSAAAMAVESEAATLAKPLGLSSIFVSLPGQPTEKDLTAAHALARVALGETELPGLDVSVAFSLGDLHRPEFVPYLGVMLQSPILHTRDAAMSAICSLLRFPKSGSPPLGGLWKPEMEEYCPLEVPIRDLGFEEKSIGFWRQWWASQKEQFESDSSYPHPTAPARYATPPPQYGRLAVPMELRFFELISDLERSRSLRRGASPEDAPRGRTMLDNQLSSADDEVLDRIARGMADRLIVHGEKVQGSLNALRVLELPPNPELTRKFGEQSVEILKSGLLELRRELSSDGWATVLDYMDRRAPDLLRRPASPKGR